MPPVFGSGLVALTVSSTVKPNKQHLTYVADDEWIGIFRETDADYHFWTFNHSTHVWIDLGLLHTAGSAKGEVFYDPATSKLYMVWDTNNPYSFFRFSRISEGVWQNDASLDTNFENEITTFSMQNTAFDDDHVCFVKGLGGRMWFFTMSRSEARVNWSDNEGDTWQGSHDVLHDVSSPSNSCIAFNWQGQDYVGLLTSDNAGLVNFIRIPETSADPGADFVIEPIPQPQLGGQADDQTAIVRDNQVTNQEIFCCIKHDGGPVSHSIYRRNGDAGAAWTQAEINISRSRPAMQYETQGNRILLITSNDAAAVGIDAKYLFITPSTLGITAQQPVPGLDGTFGVSNANVAHHFNTGLNEQCLILATDDSDTNQVAWSMFQISEPPLPGAGFNRVVGGEINVSNFEGIAG